MFSLLIIFFICYNFEYVMGLSCIIKQTAYLSIEKPRHVTNVDVF